MEEISVPLFRQIANLIEDTIVEGCLRVGDRAPSTNELAAFHAVNPATARKGLGLLAEIGVLEKRRGLGMYVTAEACDLILRRRQERFAADFVVPLIDEAVKLGMARVELHDLLDGVAESRGLYH